ncbi:mediator of RNA polymerase II transcription subunit 25-like isoform X1 [Diorhabda sublineata]|uniref:mediator of RNA polymerase II transcription subunit 25-like isoform X1 n=1 Tax=Diorhabda sublineata TaxID=1163346 RepID=UPI0024E06A3B|nr:mediator of RNA polymerase II transcription subunit 25-like isoform X1 [Diorhabda sublineata]
MVVCSGEHGLQADIIFLIEGTAVNGAYINDIKTNYIIPSLEYFNQTKMEDASYLSENANSVYGIVIFYAADCLPQLSTDTFGPFISPLKLLAAIDKLEMIGGKGESHSNIAEGLATSLHCFEELQQKRDTTTPVQKHCILICNSPPYSLPVLESHTFSGKTAEQLAGILQERNINFSVISPRKIPSLYKLFEKAGGDLSSSQTKNYAKDPRHLVLLKGFSLKERSVSPPPGASTTTPNQITNTGIPAMTSLPSPLQGSDSPIPGTSQPSNNIMVNTTVGVGANVGQNNVYRPQGTQGMNIPPQKGVGVVNVAGGRMMGNNQMPIMQVNAPPGYHASGHVNRTSPHWTMPPPVQQVRPYIPQSNQQVNTTQGSALIAQLTQPPSSISGSNVNQFGQMTSNSPINKINVPPQSNVQTSISQNQTGIQTSMAQVSQANPVSSSQAQNMPQAVQGQPQQIRERHTIWQGLLEWIEKPKNATDQQKITKHVPCQVSANSKDGEPELKADGWPQKLIMQLMPKQLIGNIGGAYLKNSKSVLFHPQPCDALESLTRVMSSGFAGCVHFTSVPPCEIKVLILLYTADKKAYLGFIPNDQVAFVDRLRKVIQQQKSTQQMRQGGPGTPTGNPQVGQVSNSPQMSGTNAITSQNAPQNMLISPTNTISMGGGQMTQNVNTTSQQGQGMAGIINQNVSSGNMRPNIRMPNIQPGNTNQSNIIQNPVQSSAENQLEVERRHNLEKINQLKQTLEAAQQQERQYKSQLERISHMKTSQLEQALQAAQQTEMHYKMLENQQRQQIAAQNVQSTPQAATSQPQQRLMRPVMSNNPGLRHLLQQQPQYRQLINVQQMPGSGSRTQMGQQLQNPAGSQQTNFDEVGSFDFNNII